MKSSVYQFLGFRLLSSIFNREENTNIKYFELKILHSSFEDKESLFTIAINVKLGFTGLKESSFVFDSGFKINDLKWFNQFDENARESFFGAIAFPFIREKINSITDDSRGSIMLPIINIRDINLRKGIKFQHREQKNIIGI